MNKLKLLSLACATAYPVQQAVAQEEKNTPERPNIILIMTDQQRFDALGAMGNEQIHTPHLDQLAQDGTLFMNAYSSTPSSTPARAGLLTGCSPWKHGMLGYYQTAPDYPHTMPQMLRDAGYFTFGIGKMHYTPQRNLYGFHGTLLDESGRVYSDDYVSDYRQWLQVQAPGSDPDLTGIGWNDHRGGVYKLKENLHPTYWTGNQAVQFIENYELDKPLFLKVSFARPHSPYDPPQRYYDMYKDQDVPTPWVGDWAERFANYPNTPDAAFGDFGVDHAVDSRKHYYAAVTFVDDQIGKVIDALKAKGIYDNSLILFVSDHGDMLGDHHHWRKTYAYEGSSHVPFIVKAPNDARFTSKRGEKLNQVVEIRDILPTFLDAATIIQPNTMDGQSVLPLLMEPKYGWREYIDLEHATCYSDENYWAALTDGKMKYIWFFSTGQEQLFDLQKDAGEEVNLAGKKRYNKELKKWRERMVLHLKERGEPYVVDGKLNVFTKTILTSPNYPKAKK